MRKLAASCALATLALAAACGSDEPDATADAPASSAAASSSAAPSSSAAAAPSSSAPAAVPTVLTGVVGTPEDPDAFVITLTDESGQPVSTLPAGEYTIQVQDLSDVHNFHLSGGSVDETTTVEEVVDTTFDVTLEPGEYTFECDPHPRMTGSFTVS